MERIDKNSIENVALEAVGLEAPAKHFVMNGKNADEILRNEQVQKFNDKVDEYVEEFEDKSKKIQEYAAYINENSMKIEIMPIYNYMLVKPFSENPFQRIVTTDSGIILDLGGRAPQYKSNETGQIEEEESFIHVGVVQEVGDKCEYVQPGDTIMWTKPSETPVPFYKQGLILLNENRVMVVINENLKERFSKNGK